MSHVRAAEQRRPSTALNWACGSIYLRLTRVNGADAADRELAAASLVGCAIGAYTADFIGRRWSIIGASIVTIVVGWIYARFNAASDPEIVLSVGFVLIVAIYVQTAILFGVYTPELFPTEIRLRANGIVNTLGRAATVVSPFIVGSLMANYQLPGVIGLMIGLLVVQIILVWAWGVEPRNRPLEKVAPAG